MVGLKELFPPNLRFATLFRRLRRQHAKPAQLLVGENHLLAALAAFQMAQAVGERIPPQIRQGQPYQNGGSMLFNVIL
jgi:hypothetical protein